MLDLQLSPPQRPLQSSSLSLAQERLWFIEQFTPGTPTYNSPIVLEINGPLDRGVLERALGELVRRHEPLRAVFRNNGGRPVQMVQACEAFLLPFEDLRTDASARHLDERIADEIRRPIDLEHGPIFRGRLLRIADNQHVAALVVHHIAFDGWSMGILLKELSILYSAYAAGKPSPLPELRTSYSEFAFFEREQLTAPQAEQQLEYWRERLAGPLPVLTLPTDRPRPPIQTTRGQCHERALPGDQMARLQMIGRRHGATPFMTMAALYSLFLHRLSGQRDIIIGTALANRARRETHPLIGFFANTLPLRIEITPEMTVGELIATVPGIAMGAYDNQHVPLSHIVEAVNPPRDLSRSPIFQTLFTFNNTPHADRGAIDAGPVTMRRLFYATGTSKADLTLAMPHGADGSIIFETNADLFDPGTGQRMLDEFCELLVAIPDDVDSRVDGLRRGQARSAPAAPTAAAGTTAPYPRAETVHRLFEAQALRDPEAPALRDATSARTYRELNEQANRLAHLLRTRWLAVGGNDSTRCVVGVCLDRSVDAVIALLAILKAGGAYVPLDPASPPARSAALAARARLRLIVTSRTFMDRVANAGAELVVLDRDAAEIAAAPVSNLAIAPPADSLAYVLFTSGTTGVPKAVGVPHRAIVRLAHGLPSIPLGHGQTVLHASPMSFDAATFELWGPLLHGGCVAIAPPLMLGAASVEHTIAAHGVTVMWLTASLFNAIVDERVGTLAPVRFLLTGGEKLSVPHVRRAIAALPRTRLFNGYGPTEATTFTTCHEITPRDLSNPAGIPIGRPLLNTRVYVVDEDMRPVDQGEAGELLIGGDGLATGYLDDPQLTAARFIADSFGESPGARLYRSGDRARILADGTVEFLGRLDDQIKLRGFRIEPGEVEAAIGKHPLVGQCAVVAAESPSMGRMLVAFYVPSPAASHADSTQQIRDALRASLPDYMIPSRWISTTSLPLLNTGKIDRQALKIRAADIANHVSLPAVVPSGTDGDVAAIWRDVLGVAEARPHDNFFDCGGHSLLAVQMLSKIEATLGITIGVRALFEAPTLAGLSLTVAEFTGRRIATEGTEKVRALRVAAPTARQPVLVGRERHVPARASTPGQIAAALLDIWCELLEVKDIHHTDGFFELGGHSLLATRLAAAIEQRFGVELPLSTLFTHGTLSAQIRLLVEALPAAEWTPLVAIKPSGTERPLFLIHGIGGEVISFQPLSRYLADVPVYGLEADRRRDAPDTCSVERIAARYVQAIMQVDAEGPYRIGGYSGGGLIALEVAQQLQAAGRRVSTLVMLDAPAQVTAQRSFTPLALARLIRNQVYWCIDDDFLKSGWTAQRTRVAQQARMLWHRVYSRVSGEKADVRDRMGLWEMPPEVSPFIEQLSARLRAYRPRPYGGSITVISARTHSLFFTTAKDLGWKTLALGGVTTRVVPGAHDTILREPRVSAFAAILDDILRRDRG